MTTTDEIIRGHHRFVREGGKWRLWGAESHPTHPGERGGLVWGPNAVSDSAWVYGSAQVCGSARVSDSARVGGSARVSDSARVGGLAWVSDSARVGGLAWVSETRHVLTVHPTASEDCVATLTRTAEGHHLRVGCWKGTIDEFRTMVLGDNWPSARTAEARAMHRPELLALADLCDARIATWGWDQ